MKALLGDTTKGIGEQDRGKEKATQGSRSPTASRAWPDSAGELGSLSEASKWSRTELRKLGIHFPFLDSVFSGQLTTSHGK